LMTNDELQNYRRQKTLSDLALSLVCSLNLLLSMRFSFVQTTC